MKVLILLSLDVRHSQEAGNCLELGTRLKLSYTDIGELH